MSPKVAERWKQTRTRGKLRYVLMDGMLGFGAALFIGLSLSSRPDSWDVWLVLTVLCLSGGAGFGFFNWHHNERKYLAQSQPNDA